MCACSSGVWFCSLTLVWELLRFGYVFYEEIISKNWLIMNGVNWLIMNGGVGYYRALHSSLVQYKIKL